MILILWSFKYIYLYLDVCFIIIILCWFIISNFCSYSLNNLLYKIPIILSHLCCCLLLLHTVRSPGRRLLNTFTGRYNNILYILCIEIFLSMMESRLVGSPSRIFFDPGKSRGVQRNWKKERTNKWRMEKRFCAEMKAIKKMIYDLFVGRKFSFYFCCYVLFCSSTTET